VYFQEIKLEGRLERILKNLKGEKRVGLTGVPAVPKTPEPS